MGFHLFFFILESETSLIIVSPIVPFYSILLVFITRDPFLAVNIIAEPRFSYPPEGLWT